MTSASRGPDLRGVPNGPVFLIANEFFDALPIRQFVRMDGRWRERVIGLDADRLVWGLGGVVPMDRAAPDGAILEKMVLKDSAHDHWPAATVPGQFVHAEFMVKNQVKYAATGGWGYARWLGQDQTPYGKDASFVQECYGCHTPVKDNDYVFTEPVLLP